MSARVGYLTKLNFYKKMDERQKEALSCWYLTGPTASGKSRVGVKLAQRIGAEIIAMDSMTVYREMDVGTAKPDMEQRSGVPHHLIDVVDPAAEYSLAQYIAAAHEKIREIKRRGKEVLFVGGTPLYLKGMLRGIFEGPPTDKEFREQLAEKMKGRPPEYLHNMLAKVDSVSAKKLHPNDLKRIVRALEVYEKTGKPISSFQKQFEVGRPASDCKVYVLQWPRDVLYARIDKRVDKMMYECFLDEVKLLKTRKMPIGQTARQALGYKELFDYLDGKLKFGQAVNLIKQHTRQYAKHQETWFRGLSECRFTPGDKPHFEGVEDEPETETMPLSSDDDDEMGM